MEEELEKILLEIISHHPKTKDDFNDARRKICGKMKTRQPSNMKLFTAYQNLLKKKSSYLKNNKLSKNNKKYFKNIKDQNKNTRPDFIWIKPDKNLELLLRKADIRSMSGVAIITSLIKPYNCPGKCIYCPTEVKMPKSYIATEPAAARALALAFSPYRQMQMRLEMLEKTGHPTDKIEYILKGGTWNAYPLRYQYWFILESFKACNDLTRKKPTKATLEKDWKEKTLEDLQNALAIEQEYNDKKAKHKIIGLTLETRPDAISPKTIWHMREQGCTRIELGLQAPDDKILELVKRGHTVEQFRQAILLLRQAGFKVDLHFMPDLPGTTAKHDVEMYDSLFTDEGLKPDMVKIYPCTVIKSAELYGWFESGKYKPYDSQELFDALLEMKKLTPYYCRISRLIRDIPSNEIEGGNAITNLREALEKELHKQGKFCKCLRCREVGHAEKIHKIKAEKLTPQLFVEEFQTRGGREFFLTFEDKERRVVFAFLRLRLPEYNDKIKKSEILEKYLGLGDLKKLAYVRELHTYGQLVNVGDTNKSASQHKGLGTKLVAEADKIAKENGYEKIAVISGVGVRSYYRKFGYKKIGTYMAKNLK